MNADTDTAAEPVYFNVYLPLWTLTRNDNGFHHIQPVGNGPKYGACVMTFLAPDLAETAREQLAAGGIHTLPPLQLNDVPAVLMVLDAAKRIGIRWVVTDPAFHPDGRMSGRYRPLEEWYDMMRNVEYVPVGHHD